MACIFYKFFLHKNPDSSYHVPILKVVSDTIIKLCQYTCLINTIHP